MWLVGYDRIMTNSNCFKRGLTSEPAYKVCLEKEEDVGKKIDAMTGSTVKKEPSHGK